MFDTRTRLFCFACLKDAAGARAPLKSAAPAPGSDQQKNRLRSRPKSGGSSGSGSATLVAGPSIKEYQLTHSLRQFVIKTSAYGVQFLSEKFFSDRAEVSFLVCQTPT